jgi:transposase
LKKKEMSFIQSDNRHQVEFSCLEDKIGKDNAVRFIEAFAEHLELDQLGFKATTEKNEGRPGFNDKLFLKIYLYGYLNGLRSSRKLERECNRNIEMQWLTGNLTPN